MDFPYVLMVRALLPSKLLAWWRLPYLSGSTAICPETEDCRGISGTRRHQEIAKDGAGIVVEKSFLEEEWQTMGRFGCGKVTTPMGATPLQTFSENPVDTLHRADGVWMVVVDAE